jgi:hypothetical protein
MDTGEISIFVVFFGLLAVILVFAFINRRARRAAWEELASQLGLNFDPGNYWRKSPSVSGTYHGHSLVLDTFSCGAGNSRITYTRIVVELNNPSGLNLAISGEGVGSGLKKMFGVKEILVGDEALDAKFFIQGSPEVAVQRLLSNTSLRQKLLETQSLHVELKGQHIIYQQRRFEANPEKLLNLFDLLANIAEAVNRLE